MSIRSRRLVAGIAAATGLLGLLADARAAWQDDIGLTELRLRLGAAMPDGTGVPVTQVEATSSGNYLPQGGVSPIEGTGNLAGKTILDASGLSTGQSSHAATVAGYFYGNNPDRSMAGGVTTITAYEADDFSGSGFLDPGGLSRTPTTETALVQNHSWIGSATDNDDLLRRLDFAIDRDGFVACVGLNNGSTTPIPKLLASAYNTIAVGRSDGSHSSGTTPTDVDGPGRIKPDLVVPVSTTSWATAVTSSAAAMLRSTPEGAGLPSEVIKAVLLAGADKSPFPGWSRTLSRPLDSRFGAGQLHVGNSHAILSAGEQEASASNEVGETGWDYRESLGPSGGSTRFFSVPPGFHATDVSVVLVWNRTIEDTAPGPSFTPEPRTHDFALSLHASGAFDPGGAVDVSDSPVDNVEHVHLPALGSGQWAIQVSGDSEKDHAVAWRATLAPDPDASVTDLTVPENAGMARITITLSAPSPLPAEIEFQTQSGTAGAGADFLSVAGKLVIPAGSMDGTIDIPIVNDPLDEDDEWFTVRITAATGAVLAGSGSTTAVVTIVDDDPEPTLAIVPVIVEESDTLVDVGVTLSAASGRTVELDYQLTGGSATPGIDHAGGTGTLVIPAGEATGTIEVGILDDTLPEADESVRLSVSAVRNATLTDESPLLVLIVDDDFAAVLADTAIVEVDGSLAVTWPAVPGRRYTVETSTDLVVWDGVPGFIAVEFPDGAVPVVTLAALDTGTPSACRFARVVDVTPPPDPNALDP